MLEKLKKLIAGEPPRQPYQDKDLARLLGISPQEARQLRIQVGLENAAGRREQVLFQDMKTILAKNTAITDRNFTDTLDSLGYTISRYSAMQYKKKLLAAVPQLKQSLAKKVAVPVTEPKAAGSAKNSDLVKFTEFIGYNNSLRLQIDQAKAAVSYPPYGLHTLLFGPSGVGKSFFARAMHSFAIQSETFPEAAPFALFNCADYADNPQLLLSQLFGYKKGSFTGALADKEGLVEQADNGILFLDEIHRLPPEGQEMLFHLLDNGTFRRLGETNTKRHVNLLLIGATTEDPNTTLLTTFKRRIPMIIELPSLKDRPNEEKYDLVKRFFTHEAEKINRGLTIKYETIQQLLSYDCPGNIGQLKSDIQVACARALLNSRLKNSEDIHIYPENLPMHTKTALNHPAPILQNFTVGDLAINITDTAAQKTKDNSVYHFIQREFNLLKESGMDLNAINVELNQKLEEKLKTFVENISIPTYASDVQLQSIVGSHIISVIKEIEQIIKKHYPSDSNVISSRFYYCLALHINSFLERLESNNLVKNPQINYIKSHYPSIFAIALEIGEAISKSLEIQLSIDEIGFIAMYINSFMNTNNTASRRVSVIILSHGKVASAIAEVANSLLGTNHIVGIDMPLSQNLESIQEQVVQAAISYNEGIGCLLLVDMGSLVKIGEIISSRTGIKTAVIQRVDTMMVLDAVRRAIINESLEQITQALNSNFTKSVNYTSNEQKKEKAIISMCITGRGASIRVKTQLEQLLEELHIPVKVITSGLLDYTKAQAKFDQLRLKYEILCIVSTINPHIPSIPFLSADEFLSEGGSNLLKNLLHIPSKNYLQELITPDLILRNTASIDKNTALETLYQLLYEKGCVKQTYLLSCFKREIISATNLEYSVAMPHGDLQDVLTSSIAVLTSTKPILWNDSEYVNCVFMLAITEKDQPALGQFYDYILSNEEKLKHLLTISSPKEMHQLLTDINYK
jgi:transcriptional regulator with AAA-type ATPase domain/transcriptional regulatory protein LevR